MQTESHRDSYARQRVETGDDQLGLYLTQHVLENPPPSTLSKTFQPFLVPSQMAVRTMRTCHGSVQSSSPASAETHRETDRG